METILKSNEPVEMLRLLVVTEFVSPASNSTGEYFFHIVTALLKAGCKIILITPESQDNKSTCESLSACWGESFECRFSKYFPSFDKSKIKAVGWFVSTLSIWYQVTKFSKKSNLIFFGTNPAFLLLFNAFSFQLWRHKSVLLCYDIFPDNYIAITDNKYKKFFARIIRPLFNSSFKKVKKVLTIGECMSTYLVRQEIPKDNIFTVSNWADGSVIHPLESIENNKYIRFQFFGNLGPMQGVEKIIDALDFITVKNASFTFAGKGESTKSIKDFIENNHTMARVDFIGGVDYLERNKLLNDCDIAIVCLDKRITGMGVPSKAYYSLAAGKPLLVIADATCETSRIVDKYDLGWVVSTDSSEDIAIVIDEICKKPLVVPSSDYIRNVFEENFDRNICTDRIVNALLDVAIE